MAQSSEVINDLIEINNDRVAGFEKAAKDLSSDDQDLRTVFSKLSADSRSNAAELGNYATAEHDKGTSVLGTIHRAWIDVKATFTGHDRKSVLQECERGEDAIKKAYKTALESDNNLPADVSATISRQKQAIDAGHDQIKALRDSQV